MKKMAIVVVIANLLSAHAWAGPVSESLAMEYLKISKVEDIINATITQYDSQLSAQITPGDKAKLHDLLVRVMGWEAIKDQLVAEVRNVFTQEEIDASIAFMKTPAGASATAKGAEFSKRMASIVSSNLQKSMVNTAPQGAAKQP
jgi:hypothetical protein